MSSWFDELPPDWVTTRLKNVVEDVRTGVWGADANGGPDDIACVRVADFDRSRFGLKAVETLRSISEGDRTGRLLAPGDILLEKSGGTDQNPVGFSVMFDELYPAVSSNFIARLRVRPEHSARYWLYSLAASYATRRTERSVRRTTGIQNLDQTAFFNELFPSPPQAEQRAIADFLDRETAQIDTLIAEQQRLIELLHERRDAAWSSSVQNLMTQYPPLPVRRVVDTIVDGPFGSSLTSSHYTGAGTRVIRLGNIGINAWRGDDEAFISDDYAAQLSQHSVDVGDVVIAGLGDERWPLGRATVVPEIGPAIVKADCYRVRPTKAVSGAYLAWALSAPPTRSQYTLLSRGSTRARLNTTVAREARIPVPPMNVQDQIVVEWNRTAAALDTLIVEAERFIELARERRSALITAAVTGQIEVPGVE